MTSRRHRSLQRVSERRDLSPRLHCTRYARSLRKLLSFAILTAVLSGCAKSPARIVVGSQSATGQVVAGEIVAQHLEHRLGRKVQRRLGIGDETVVYQELQTQQISVYPAFTSVVETEVLKEQPSPDPDVVWERTHGELDRIAKLELFKPLGYENPPVLVVRNADAEKFKVSTIGEAAAASTKWEIGVSYQFQQRNDAVNALNSFNLPMAKPTRGMEPAELFPALQRGDLSMIVADSIDGQLTSPGYRVLADDRHAFAPSQACLLARQDVLTAEPQLRAFLSELTGKFTAEKMRKMSADVDLRHREPAEVAAEFLSQAGLK